MASTFKKGEVSKKQQQRKHLTLQEKLQIIELREKMIPMKFVAQKSFKVCLVTSKVTLKRLKKS